jgi:hypothetical protein
MSIDIPSQTVDGWYERGDPQREARELAYYLQTLVWGADGAAQAQAEGKSIEVEMATGQVLLREAPENVERIRREVNPSIQAVLRERTLQGGRSGSQVTAGTFSAPPNALPGVRVIGAQTDQPAFGTGSSPGAGGTRTFSLRLDDNRTVFGIHFTLIDVFQDADESSPSAVLLLESPDLSDEVTIRERRSINFEGMRIRLVEATISPQQEVNLEVIDLRR